MHSKVVRSPLGNDGIPHRQIILPEELPMSAIWAADHGVDLAASPDAGLQAGQLVTLGGPAGCRPSGPADRPVQPSLGLAWDWE
eukprot:354619-Chlamydomonas_euryale.AAC.9